VQFTYEIQPRPPDILWNALRHKKRSKIRRAKEVLTTIAIDDPELYWNFYESNLKQRGIHDFHYDKVTTTRLIEACFARGCGRIYAAKDAFGSLVAAVFSPGMGALASKGNHIYGPDMPLGLDYWMPLLEALTYTMRVAGITTRNRSRITAASVRSPSNPGSPAISAWRENALCRIVTPSRAIANLIFSWRCRRGP
jgi:hypothetical protein